jgi:hypothetical protein
MASVPERPIRLGCFDVRNGSVVVADDSVPVAAEFDRASGAVIRAFSWAILNDRRNRPAALDILISGSSMRTPLRCFGMALVVTAEKAPGAGPP